MKRPIAELWAELEAAGEDNVRDRLATGVYGTAGGKKPLVEEWLRKKDQERAEALNREHISIARSAADAARDAATSARDTARAARRANHIAMTAVAVAIVSVIATVIITLASG